jgi:hypothetical protein
MVLQPVGMLASSTVSSARVVGLGYANPVHRVEQGVTCTEPRDLLIHP